MRSLGTKAEMGLSLAIRNAAPADAPMISALIHGESIHCTVHPDGEGAEHFFSSITPQAIAAYISSPNYLYFVGSVGPDLAGIVAIRDLSHLIHLFVAAKFHRRGIGSALWAHAKARALEKGNRNQFTVHSTRIAVPFYERLGFEAEAPPMEKNGIAFVPMKMTFS
jgi:GNAT superfamily N-acetyltransferase